MFESIFKGKSTLQKLIIIRQIIIDKLKTNKEKHEATEPERN